MNQPSFGPAERGAVRRQASSGYRPLLLLSPPWGMRQAPFFADRLGVEVEVLGAGEAPAQLARADLLAGAIRQGLTLDRATLLQLERCRFVQVAGVGVDHVDLEAAGELGLPIANSGDANACAVAEWTVMAMLALLHSAHRRHEELRAGRWAPLPGTELAGKQVGVVGLGRIGSRVADLVAAFGATVIAHDARPVYDARWRLVPLAELLAAADVVTIHVPLLPSTYHLLDAAALRLMKGGAVLINAARGGVVDEASLTEALRDGRLAGAAIDVFETEPVDGTNPLVSLPNVLLSPHAAATTRETGHRTREFALANLARVLRGEPPDSIVTRTSAPRHVPAAGS